jgi:hypothetical protein
MTNLEQALDSLTRTRDTVRLELHLLSMDARTKWDALESRILAVEGKVGAQAEIASDATVSVATELSDAVKEFVDAHVRNIHR